MLVKVLTLSLSQSALQDAQAVTCLQTQGSNCYHTLTPRPINYLARKDNPLVDKTRRPEGLVVQYSWSSHRSRGLVG